MLDGEYAIRPHTRGTIPPIPIPMQNASTFPFKIEGKAMATIQKK